MYDMNEGWYKDAHTGPEQRNITIRNKQFESSGKVRACSQWQNISKSILSGRDNHIGSIAFSIESHDNHIIKFD